MDSEILECPINDFLRHYAPFYPSDSSVTIAQEELEKSHLKPVDSGSGKVWALAPYIKPPRDIKTIEPTVFNCLENIIGALEGVGCADANEAPRDRLFSYKSCLLNNKASEIEGTNFKVDAYITSDPKAKKLILSDAVAVAEFKKKGDPESTRDVSSCRCIIPVYYTDTSYQNRLKMISVASQIMNDDPRRMWVYGVCRYGSPLEVVL